MCYILAMRNICCAFVRIWDGHKITRRAKSGKRATRKVAQRELNFSNAADEREADVRLSLALCLSNMFACVVNDRQTGFVYVTSRVGSIHRT